MKRALLGLLIGCMTMGVASLAFAGDNANAGISLHITNPPAKATNCVNNAPDFGGQGGKKIVTKGLPCTSGQFGEFDVWVLVCNGSDSLGVAGLEYGIEYDGAFGSGVDITSWQLCADLEFTSGGYPAAGSGNLITWEPSQNCQNDPAEFHGFGGGGQGDTNPNGKQGVRGSVIAVAGVFRVNIWGSDTMEITPRPVSGKLAVADCRAAVDNLTNKLVARGGIAAFCSNYNGYNFCAKGALAGEQETTWGKIKTKYETN
jgi:hypothetical protein